MNIEKNSGNQPPKSLENEINLSEKLSRLSPEQLKTGRLAIETIEDDEMADRWDAEIDREKNEREPGTYKYFIVRFRYDPYAGIGGRTSYANDVMIGTFDYTDEAYAVLEEAKKQLKTIKDKLV